MGLFDFLKSKKSKASETERPEPELPANNPQTEADIIRFEQELFATVPRYISKPGATIDIRARHQETHEIIPFAVGFPEQFEPWRTVQSLADRRGILYTLLDSQFGKQLELWQAIERYNDDRYAEKALEIAMKHRLDTDEQMPDYWSALARTYFILTNYEEAQRCCAEALSIDPANIRAKRIYADVLHVTNHPEEAHDLYNEILTARLPADLEINLSVQELLGFDGDITNSPIYALSWLKSDQRDTDEVWEWANEEFYYSPHFRTQYAFHLIHSKAYMKGLVKLLTVSKEMPWFKDAVVHSYRLIDQLHLSDSMQDEKIRLRALMVHHKWE